MTYAPYSLFIDPTRNPTAPQLSARESALRAKYLLAIPHDKTSKQMLNEARS